MAERGALSPAEAAAWLGISRSTLYADVLAELHVVRLGRRTLVPITELQRWLDEHASKGVR